MSTVNLLPDDYIQRRNQHRANVLCAVLFVIVMCSIVGAGFVSDASGRHTQEVRDRLNNDYADAGKLIAQMQQLQVQKQEMIRKAEVTSSLQERVPRSYLLAVIADTIPEHTALMKFDLDTKRIIVRDAKPASKFDALAARGKAAPATVAMEITGLAATDVEVARFIANLARNPLVTGVDLVYSQEKIIDKQAAREFQVRLELKANADVIDAPDQAGQKTARDKNDDIERDGDRPAPAPAGAKA